jgi:putative ABC transport system permease protein
VNSIVLLLSRDFGKLILIAFVVSAPMAWFAINWWLEGYTYKTEVGAYVYIIAGALAMIIALLTMAYQSIRAANSDPVKSLKSE